MRPIWKWPTPLRQPALLCYLLWWFLAHIAFYLIAIPVVFVAAGLTTVWEGLAREFPTRRGWRGGWVWTRATWRGEHVGEALMANLENEERKL